MNTKISILSIITYLFAGFCVVSHAAEKKVNFINRDFGKDDHTAKSWQTSDGKKLLTKVTDAEHGESLIIPAEFPGLVQAQRGSDSSPVYLAIYDRFGKQPTAVVEKIGFDIFVPSDMPSGARVGCTFYAKSKDGVWFQAHPLFAETGKPATALNAGWNKLVADISEATGYLEPVGNKEIWSRMQLGLTRQFGFNIFCDQEYKGNFAIDNFSAWMAEDDFPDKLGIVSFKPGPASLPRMEMYEASFRVNRPLLNPYNTREVDIFAEVTADGTDKPLRIPAFFYQHYVREKGSDKSGEDYRDSYSAGPQTEFRIRITPQKAGKYQCRLKIRYTSPVTGKTEEYTGDPFAFSVTENKHKGFVRVSKEDKHSFEFMDNSFFYPVGYNFHSPVDIRHVQRILQQFFPDAAKPLNKELRIYESAIPRMKAAGINTFEVWMSSWWLELEWTKRWSGYNGVNYYNQQHAYKLDTLIETCRKNDMHIHLVIDNHGKASAWCDPEWNNSPYNRRNGGLFRTPEEFFTSPEGMEYYKDKYRYIAARWGYSPVIFGIEMWSELDLTGSRNNRGDYRSETVRTWIEKMSACMKQYDQGQHPLTVHYSSNFRKIDQELVKRPAIDYVVGDAYHDDKQPLVKLLEQTQQSLANIGKPYIMTEFCGNFNASSLEVMYGDMYSGLWYSWCTNAGGGPFSWWHELINQEDYYPIYAAFSRFIEGEDKRRKNGAPQLTVDWKSTVVFPEDKGMLQKIESMVKKNEEEATSIDPKTQKKSVKSRPFRTVINGKRYAVTNVKLLAEIKELAQQIKSYKSQILGDGNIFYCYIYDEKQLDRMPLDEKNRDLSKGLSLELTTGAPGSYNIEVWDCYKGMIINTVKDLSSDNEGILRVRLPDFQIQCALKIRKNAGSIK